MVPGRPTNLDNSGARAYCACSRCGRGLLEHFFPHVSYLSSGPSLWETARYRLDYYLKGPLNPKQPTNQLQNMEDFVLRFAFLIGVVQGEITTLVGSDYIPRPHLTSGDTVSPFGRRLDTA